MLLNVGRAIDNVGLSYNLLNNLFESRPSVKPENKIKKVFICLISTGLLGVCIFKADIDALCYPRHLE